MERYVDICRDRDNVSFRAAFLAFSPPSLRRRITVLLLMRESKDVESVVLTKGFPLERHICRFWCCCIAASTRMRPFVQVTILLLSSDPLGKRRLVNGHSPCYTIVLKSLYMQCWCTLDCLSHMTHLMLIETSVAYNIRCGYSASTIQTAITHFAPLHDCRHNADRRNT